MPETPEIDGYSDLVRVARGGFGVVYRARQDRHSRVVAVKVLDVEDFDERGHQRFARECRAMGSLSWHPNVVALLDSGISEHGQPFLVMEFLSAGSLGDRLRDGPLPWAEAVAAGIQVAGALDVAHAAGVLHRDLKPENLLVGPYGEIKLGDFGIAAIEGATRTATGRAAFTVDHVAPELVRGSRPDERSDVYGLASTLHTLIAGRAPFGGEADEPMAAQMMRVLETPPPRLANVPEQLADLLVAGLAKEPTARPSSAAMFGRSLQQIETDDGRTPTPLRLAAATSDTAAGAGGDDDPPPSMPTPQGDPRLTISPAEPGRLDGDPRPTIVPAGSLPTVDADGVPGIDPPVATTPPSALPAGPVDGPQAVGDGPPAGSERRLTRTVAIAIIAAIVVLAVGSYALSRGGDNEPSNQAEGGGTAATTTTAAPVPTTIFAPVIPPDVTGEVIISGSSTVQPISVGVAESFADVAPNVAVNVDGPGTSDGFELFCAGETDINDASRPIKEEEVQACADGGVEFIELEIALDGITVMTNPANDAVSCLDLNDLYALTGPESEGFDNWSSAQDLATELGSDTELPDAPFDMTAPGEESGTYGAYIDLATKSIAEAQFEAGAIEEDQVETLRPDYTTQANDNAIIQGVEGSDSSFGFVGYAFAEEAGDAVKEIEIAGEDGTCVAPSAETVADGSYPLSRSLYLYINAATAEENPGLAAYVNYYLGDGITSVTDVGYVAIPADRLAASQETWVGRTTGSRHGG